MHAVQFLKSLFSVSEKSTLMLSCLKSHPPRALSIITYLCIEYLNSFDVRLVTCFCVCVCSQAFQQTLSRATEIASRNSLRSTTHMQKHGRSQFHRFPRVTDWAGPRGLSSLFHVEWICNVLPFFFCFRLKSLFYRSSNLQYFKRLIQIPQLPEVRTPSPSLNHS